MAARTPRPADAFAARRQGGRRRRPGLLRAARLLAVVLALAGGVWWLTTGDLFSLKRVETGAYRFTDEADLEARLTTLLGRNLWRLGQGEIADTLADLPWVREVGVSRRLPANLRLEIREWRPLISLADAGPATGGTVPRVLVGDGRVLAFPADLEAPALPVLVGVPVVRDSTGVLRLEPILRDGVLALLSAVDASGLETICPVDFVVARTQGFAIVLQDGRGSLLVGREGFRDRLERYLVARDHLAQGLEVDLRFRDRITVRRPES